MDIALIIQAVLFAILLMFSGFFSSSETAFFSLNPTNMEQLRHTNHPRLALIEKLLNNPRRLIVTILIGNELVNVAASNISASLLLRFVEAEDMWWVNITIMLPILLLIGEITPKTLAVRNNTAFVTYQSQPIHLFSRLITPIRWIVRHISDFFITLIIGKQIKKERVITEDMVRTLTNEAANRGQIDEQEKQYIHKIFDFGNKTTKDVMTPRMDMYTLSINSTLKEVLAVFQKTRAVRVPLFDGDRDNIIGVLLYRDLLRTDPMALKKAGSLRSIMREPFFVPETRPAADLFHLFHERKRTTAFALDEHGGISGFITIEHLLHKVLDADNLPLNTLSKEKTTQALKEGQLTIQGSMEIHKFNQITQANLPETAKSMAGLLFHHKGELPQEGDVISLSDWHFTILSMQGRRIHQINACAKKPQQEIKQITYQEKTDQQPIEVPATT
ncbi:hemolysin family protein [Magnetococcales bacterium HHB-1]